MLAKRIRLRLVFSTLTNRKTSVRCEALNSADDGANTYSTQTAAQSSAARALRHRRHRRRRHLRADRRGRWRMPGMHAPWAFVLAAVVMGLTVVFLRRTLHALSGQRGGGRLCEGRVQFAPRCRPFTGLLMIATGDDLVSHRQPRCGRLYPPVHRSAGPASIVIAVVAVLALVAAWGILESVV